MFAREGSHGTTTEVVGDRHRPRPGTDINLTDQLLLLQQTAGNRATAELIHRQVADAATATPRAAPAAPTAAPAPATTPEAPAPAAAPATTPEASVPSEASEAAPAGAPDATPAAPTPAPAPAVAPGAATPAAAPEAATPAAVPTSMSRGDFETAIAARYGVSSVAVGTLESQIAGLDRLAGRVEEGVTRPGQLLGQLVAAGTLSWAPWDPGSESTVYSSILQGFADLARVFGGTPPVDSVVFYQTDYHTIPGAPGLERNPTVGATYSGHVLNVYIRATSAAPGFPIERDQPGTPGRRPVLQLSEQVAGVTVHELAHGIQEAALTPPRASTSAPPLDPSLMTDYQRTVGWVGSSLYDIGDDAISAAVRSGRPPATARPITRETWNSGQWHEQPVSAYSLDNASEDFAEAVRAFVESPSSLRSRSPRRFEFLEARRSVIEHYLRAPTTSSSTPH